MKKIIELTPLADMGKGQARVSTDSVEIEVHGIIGGMKAWLVGGEEAEKIGNLVEGKLNRRIDTTRHNGILITQSGRQIMMGAYAESIVPTPKEEEEIPFDSKGIKWEKITQKSYAGLCEELRYVLSHKNVYRNYRQFGHYWAGENEICGALALRCDNESENPFLMFKDMCEYKNGYVILCVDKNTKKICKLNP